MRSDEIEKIIRSNIKDCEVKVKEDGAGHYEDNVISDRTAIIGWYALCGFANLGSIGIQLGGIGSMAPKRRTDLSKLAFKAMIGGALASWLTATVAGILI